MAEEKSKKSIVLADDSDDDEYASEKYSEQTELSSILDKLSLGPEKKKKKLLILSPNGLLLYRVHVQNLRRKPENRSPDATCGPNLVYKRPFAGEFMKFCLERFEVGIWSSANESNVDIILNIVLEDLKNKLLFVWVRLFFIFIYGYISFHICICYLTLFVNSNVFQDLSKVFQKFKEFSASNTILIDNEPYKALINPDNTGVFPVTYDPTDKMMIFLVCNQYLAFDVYHLSFYPEGEFCSYLDDLANATDVQAYIKENSFGQPKIDSSHPDWSFYCKVSKIVSFLA
ncbi:hypothetical protein Bca52824_045054 [Brassica carinata]|uniref:Mitochondrial import inner membrane translocase subunit TIM50 n=1 Tax=Brassica carinata TaxID=52824 RepID=A0A8X7UML2_BRACI|nr:hypothetical protein Bca52824_045054 [Brassica carinata]